MRENQAKGGRASSRQARLQKKISPSLKVVLDLLIVSVAETHDGQLQPARAAAMASLASALIRLSEYATLETRVQDLERRLGTL